MKLIEAAVSAAIAVSVAGVSYVAFNSPSLTGNAEAVAEQADCRTVDTAVAGYLAQYGRAPEQITDLEPFVRGDISAYRMENGLATGPGCP